MFGHQDDQQNNKAGEVTGVIPAPQQAATDTATNDAMSSNAGMPIAPATDPAVEPAIDDALGGEYSPPADGMLQHHSDGVVPPLPQPSASQLPMGDDDTNGLLSIKQQALQQLSPLVGHLEQTPEEKFRTTMMMMQATDDQSLVKTAYAAAGDIPDEKARAQALLDVVNEINYFTQHQAAAN